MNDTLRLVERFVAQDPQQLLRRLVEHRRALPEARRDDVPMVTIATADGARYAGWVLDLSAKEGAVLVHVPSDDHRHSSHVAYISLTSVSAVVVHDAAQLAPLLSNGAVSRAPGESAPSRLEVRRRAAAISDEQSTVLKHPLTLAAEWDRVPEGGDASLNLCDLFEAIRGAIRRTAEDEVGRSAWAGLSEVVVRHEPGAALCASRSGARVVLSTDLSRALPVAPEGAVQGALNSVL